LLLAGVVVALTSCAGQESSPTSYYVLAYFQTDESPRFEEPHFRDDVVVLEPTVDAVFDRRQIVRRVSPTELRYLLNDLWAVPPSDAFERAIREALSETGAFPRVYQERRDVDPRYRVASLVRAVELVDQDDGPPLVHFEVELQLIDGNRLVSQSTVSVQEPIETGGTGAFVDEVSRILSRSIDELVNRAAQSESGDAG
jgi:ABC-type uncharacterized transport system auxiliary subunit